MKTLYESLLSADYDVDDSVISIGKMRRAQNDMYICPNQTALKVVAKSVRDDLGLQRNWFNATSWLVKNPAVCTIMDWICSKPVDWLDEKKTGDFYLAFYNQCLNDAGRKRKWTLYIDQVALTTKDRTRTVGTRITVKMLMGSKWAIVARIVAYDK